jgi:hypothetical protein
MGSGTACVNSVAILTHRFAMTMGMPQRSPSVPQQTDPACTARTEDFSMIET